MTFRTMASERLTQLLSESLTHVTRPTEGLPDPVFQFALKIVPMINVDLDVRDEAGRVLLAWREDEFGVGWHIPGGIIRRGESFLNRVNFVAEHELGLTVLSESKPYFVLELYHQYGRGHFISLLFRCKPLSRSRYSDLFTERQRPQHNDLAWFDHCPPNLYPSQRPYSQVVWPDPSCNQALETDK